jgi:outer membrane receptor protein involved in Fe transport
MGADWRLAEGETNEHFRYVGGVATAYRVAGGTSRTGGGFVELDGEVWGALRLWAGARIDGWSLADGRLREVDLLTGATIRNEPAPDRSGTEWTWRAGASWPVPGAEALTLRLAGYTGWRLPTLNELHRPFRAGQDATAANPFLVPERLTGVEGGLDFQPLPGARLSLTGYSNRLDGAIANVTLGQGPGVFPGVGFVAGSYRRRENLEAINAHGLEVDAEAQLGALGLSLGFALADATVDGGALAPALTGKRPAQTPRHWVTAGLRYGKGPVEARLDLRHEGARFEDDLNQRPLAAMTTIDLGLAVSLGRRVQLSLDGSNLTNAFVETGFSGNLVERAEPRTLMVGLTFTP